MFHDIIIINKFKDVFEIETNIYGIIDTKREVQQKPRGFMSKALSLINMAVFRRTSNAEEPMPRMEKLKIIKDYRDSQSILRKKSSNVEDIDQATIDLLNGMRTAMYVNRGVGIAAPQVGIGKRITVLRAGFGKIELINPQIVYQQGQQYSDEGCLSIPYIRRTIIRPRSVTVQALDRNGKERVIEGRGQLACVLCHEIDHLDGVLFIDKK